MYTKQQITKGVIAYLLQELANNQCHDIRKWAIPFAGEPYIMGYIDQFDDILKVMNLITDDGLIDIDSVYNRLVKIAEEQGPITHEIKFIGPMKLSTEDVMRLYNIIKMTK